MDIRRSIQCSFWHYTGFKTICKGFCDEIFKFLIQFCNLLFFRPMLPALHICKRSAQIAQKSTYIKEVIFEQHKGASHEGRLRLVLRICYISPMNIESVLVGSADMAVNSTCMARPLMSVMKASISSEFICMISEVAA